VVSGGGDGDLIHGDGAQKGCDCSVVVVVVKGHTESDNGAIHRVQALGAVICERLRRVRWCQAVDCT
jgi:hypothetical protein